MKAQVEAEVLGLMLAAKTVYPIFRRLKKADFAVAENENAFAVLCSLPETFEVVDFEGEAAKCGLLFSSKNFALECMRAALDLGTIDDLVLERLVDRIKKAAADRELNRDNVMAQARQHLQEQQQTSKTVAIVPPAEYGFSESEAARRFGDIVRGRAVFAADAGVWYFHDGQRFTKDHGNGWMLGESLKVSLAYAADAVRSPTDAHYQDRLDMAKRYNGLAGRKRLIELAEANTEGLRVMAAQFDCDPWLLNCLNGTIDLHAGHLRPHSAADLLTKMAPVNYDSAAKCPRWEQFLVEVLPDAETIAFVQLFVGFCLTGSTKNHVVAFLYGAGANGKSVLSETITTMLGDYAATLPATVLMAKEYQGHACELMPLRGARWTLFRELPAGKFDEPKVKAFASADTMTARNLFEGPVSWAPTHKVVLTGNHKPIVRGQDEGIWRRLKLIPFDRVVPPEKRDLDLPAKLRDEMPGVLNWAIAGCEAWKTDPLVLEKACASVVLATAEYREESDRLAPFLGECCVLAPDARVTRSALRANYEAWCSREGEHPANPRDFGERLRQRGVADAKMKVAGESVRGWQGIGLLTDGGKGGQVDTSGQQYPLTSIDSLSHEGDRGKRSPPHVHCPPLPPSEAPDPIAQLFHCLRVRPETTASDADQQTLAEHFAKLNGTAEASGQRLWAYWKAAPSPTVAGFLASEPKAKGGAA